MLNRESKRLFIEAVKRGLSIASAAEVIGLSRQQAIDLREQDLVFAAAWDDATETAIDGLEDIAVSRAKAENDKLLELLLKAKRPEVYARPEATTNQQTIVVNMPTLEDLNKKYKEYGLTPPVFEGDFAEVRRITKPETNE